MGFFGSLFGGAKPSPREQWQVIREHFDPRSPVSHRVLADTAYEAIYGIRLERDLVAYNAAHHVALMVHLRKHDKIDMGRLSPPGQALPLPAGHVLYRACDFLDHAIKLCLDELATREFEHKLEGPLFTGRLFAASIWRNYLLALCRPCSEWDQRETCALASFRILGTVSQAEVLEHMHLASPSSEKEMISEDWPPPGFNALYVERRADIDQLLRKYYGRGISGV